MFILGQDKDIIVNADVVSGYMISDRPMKDDKWAIGVDTTDGTAIIGRYTNHITAQSAFNALLSALMSDDIKLLEMPQDMEE